MCSPFCNIHSYTAGTAAKRVRDILGNGFFFNFKLDFRVREWLVILGQAVVTFLVRAGDQGMIYGYRKFRTIERTYI